MTYVRVTRFIMMLAVWASTLTAGAAVPDSTARKACGNAACGAAGACDASDRYDYFFLEAMVQRQKGNSTAVFDLLRHCIEINPGASEAYYYLAQYYLSLKDKDTATRFFKRAADLSPGNTTYIETLARSYAAGGKFEDAIATFERLLSVDKERDDVLEILCQLYQQQGDFDNAVKAVSRLEELEGKSERLSYTKSEIYSQQNRNEEAIAEIKQLADQYPNDLNYRGMYGDMLLMNGHEKEAIGIFRSILAEEPANTRAQMSVRTYYKQDKDTVAADSMTLAILTNRNTQPAARIYIMRQEVMESENAGGDSTRILALFDSVAAAGQADEDMLLLQAAYMDLKKMGKDSINAVLVRVLGMAPDNAAARLQLVADAYSAEDYARVIALCAEARQYNPDEMAFYYYQGHAYIQTGDDAAALHAFKNGIDVINDKSDPGIVSDFYSLMGHLLYEAGERERAFAAYDSCLQWKSDNIEAMNNYAYFLSLDGTRLDKAEAMSYKTIKAQPKSSTYLDTYAWILFMQQRYAEAKVYIDQAVQADSTGSAVITEHAGDIHAKAGDIDKAVEYWTEALGKDPGNKILARKIKKRKYLK